MVMKKLRVLVDWLRFEFIRSFGLMALALSALLIGWSLYVYRFNEVSRGRGKPVIAVITGFGAGTDRFNLSVFVSAQDAKGIVGGANVKPNNIAGCRVGDKIRAIRDGISLTLLPAPCPINLQRPGADQ